MSESLKKILSLLLCSAMLFGFAAAGVPGALSVIASADDVSETAVPVKIINVTETEIELKAVEGYEYSIDKGVTFTDNPVFKGLQKGQTCFVCQRKAAAGDAQAGAISDCVEVKTNTAPVFIPDVNSIKAPEFEKESEIRAGVNFNLFAYCSYRAGGELQWGDIVYIPAKYELYKGNEKESEGIFILENTSTGQYRAVLRTVSAGNDYSVKVFYTKTRYEGPENGYIALDMDLVKTLGFRSRNAIPGWIKTIKDIIEMYWAYLISYLFRPLSPAPPLR